MMQVEVLTCVNLPSRNGDILWHVSPAARKKTCIRLSGWVGVPVYVCGYVCLSVCAHVYVHACGSMSVRACTLVQ